MCILWINVNLKDTKNTVILTQEKQDTEEWKKMSFNLQGRDNDEACQVFSKKTGWISLYSRKWHKWNAQQARNKIGLHCFHFSHWNNFLQRHVHIFVYHKPGPFFNRKSTMLKIYINCQGEKNSLSYSHKVEMVQKIRTFLGMFCWAWYYYQDIHGLNFNWS